MSVQLEVLIEDALYDLKRSAERPDACRGERPWPPQLLVDSGKSDYRVRAAGPEVFDFRVREWKGAGKGVEI